MKKVLITNFEIVQFSGSEIHSTTVAKYLKENGYEIYMGVIRTDAPLYEHVKDNIDHVIYLLNNDFDFTTTEFDLVWVQHSFLLDWLIFEKDLRAKKIVVNSLSPKEPFECAPVYANKLTLTLANSQETYNQLKEKEKIENVHLFENYSFTSYFNEDANVKELKKIAVVSNHIPDEEMQAIELLKQKGYVVDIYGFAGTQKLVTDEVLKNYDCIITIGKTVQYAMSLKIPVYIYDIHGGGGYLTVENMELNRSHNFSGRGFERKNAEQIAKEVIENFENQLEQLEQIKQYAFSNFCFEQKMQETLQKIEESPEVNVQAIKEEYSHNTRNFLVSKRLAEYDARTLEETLNKTMINFYLQKDKELAEKQTEIDNSHYLMRKGDEEIARLQKEIQSAQKEIEKSQQQIEKLKNKLNYIENSKSWRYTKIFRKGKEEH